LTAKTDDNSGSELTAVIETSMGTMVIQLLPEVAPQTVANFVKLAKSGFYEGLVWHRVVKGFVIQTGDPNTKGGKGEVALWGTGGGPNTVPLEARGGSNVEGSLGLARGANPNSGSSQFYINLTNNSAALDGQYTVFGKVISGIGVARAIGEVQVRPGDRPINNVFLVGVTIKEGQPAEGAEKEKETEPSKQA
jgi:cyclophilin family peptidyl-prolyl cis-trans isomerase